MEIEKNIVKEKRQPAIAVSPRVHQMIRAIARKERRPMSSQLELMAEQECKRLHLLYPSINQQVK